VSQPHLRLWYCGCHRSLLMWSSLGSDSRWRSISGPHIYAYKLSKIHINSIRNPWT
jgi:hypothetical protein